MGADMCATYLVKAVEAKPDWKAGKDFINQLVDEDNEVKIDDDDWSYTKEELLSSFDTSTTRSDGSG